MKPRKDKLKFAREMRKTPTRAESALWEELRFWRYAGVRFRRQKVIRGYIVDFYCPKARLAVEVDGPIHNPYKDAIRDSHIRRANVRVIRFTNSTVFKNLPQVLVNIRRAYRSRIKYLAYQKDRKEKALQHRTENAKSRNPQDSSSQQGINGLYVEEKQRERSKAVGACGYVQITGKNSEVIEYVKLPLYSASENPVDTFGCSQQTFAGMEVAETFANTLIRFGIEGRPFVCSSCKKIHVAEKKRIPELLRRVV